MSCRINSKRGCFISCATFAFVPVKKLSTHSTSCPAASRCSQRCEPRKPAPPVTSIFFTWRRSGDGSSGLHLFNGASAFLQPVEWMTFQSRAAISSHSGRVITPITTCLRSPPTARACNPAARDVRLRRWSSAKSGGRGYEIGKDRFIEVDELKARRFSSTSRMGKWRASQRRGGSLVRWGQPG
jgi:hypothetical protein